MPVTEVYMAGMWHGSDMTHPSRSRCRSGVLTLAECWTAPVTVRYKPPVLINRARASVRRLSSLVAAIFSVLLIAATASPLPASAQQQNEIILSVDFDGTAGFADALDDGSGNGVHTPGNDGGPNNNVVRTNDQIQYRIDWNVNEVDGTAVTIRMTLPEEVSWMEDPSTPTGIPAGCASGSIDGLDGRELVCVTDAEHEGSNGAIHPRAFVAGLLDGDNLGVTASVESGESAPVVSNQIDTVVSARPKADWIKGKPVVDSVSGSIIGFEPDEIIYGIDNGGVDGRIFVWNLRLVPSGGLKGAEPLNDSAAIQFFDHMYLATPDAVLATGLMPNGRSACGGYDGSGAYPFGSAGLGTPTQTTAGTWTCTDLTPTSGLGYPSVQIDITGQDTSAPVPQNADFSANGSTLISGQIAFWMSDSELDAMAVPRIIANGITGSDAEVTAAGSIDAIQVTGTNGEVDEADFGLNNASPYEFPPGPVRSNPGRSYRHWIRYQNGPYQEWQGTDPNTGIVYRGMDRRAQSLGGTGYTITDGANGTDRGNHWRWDGDGQTPRGNLLTVVADFTTVTSRAPVPNTFTETIHGCVVLDPTHQEIVPFAPTYDYVDVDPHPTLPSLIFNRSAIGGGTGTPTSPLAHVLSGAGGVTTTAYWPGYQAGPAISLGDIGFVVEFAAGAVTPTNAVAQHGVTCNEADADGAFGWVDSADAAGLEQFDADGDGRYELITHVRIRGTEDVAWHSLSGRGVTTYGATYQLNLQVRVKDDPIAQAADQELFVYSSRATGEWDGVGQPPTDRCTNTSRFTGGSDTDIPGGWCNLEFTDDGSSSTDITDFKNDYDGSTVERVDTVGRVRGAHSDAIYIVEPQLGISKKNLDGPSDIVVNGSTVEFEVRPAVTGSSLDSIANVRITDFLGANYQFVGFTQLPSTPGASCAPSGAGIACSFGEQFGGWSDVVRYEVIVVNAGANATLKNTVTIRGDDSNTGDPKTPASSSAFSYTPAPFEESGIIKVLPGHLGACTLADECETIAADSGMVFELLVENEGNVDLENYRLIDVLPFNGDAVEPASATGVTGDGRTPASAFTGTLEFVSAFGAAGTTYLYSADPPATISRDPDVSEGANTWCSSPAGGTAVFGTGACPASAADVTAVYADLGTLAKGGTKTVTLQLDTVGNTCGDYYTNTFGGRTDGLLLPIRSNDVTILTAVCDPGIDIEKGTNGSQADTFLDAASSIAGAPVTWTYVVQNTGSVAIAPATVTDSQGVTVDCDIDGDGALDGTNVIPVLLPAVTINCEGSGSAPPGPYENEGAVSGPPAVPDFGTCGCDPLDSTTWPTDGPSYGPVTDPVTGLPVYPVQEDEDLSHLIGLVPDPAMAVEKSTNGADADTPTGPAITVGAPVTWTYTVVNFGNTGLIDAEVTDSEGVTVDCDVDGDGTFDDTNLIPFMAPGGVVVCEGTGAATAGQYTNTASVTGDPVLPDFATCGCSADDFSTWPPGPGGYGPYTNPDGSTPGPVSDDDPSHYFGFEPGPALEIEKATNGDDADAATGPVVTVGGAVTWTYVVANTGNTALIDALVIDSDPAVTPDCGDGTNLIPLLAVGDSVTCTATGAASPGQYENTASVGGTPVIPDFDACGCDPEDPATWPTDAAGYVPATDASGVALASVEDEDDSHYYGFDGTPAIDIEKDTDGNQADDPADHETLIAGNPVTWTFVVTNTGDTALADATVTDDQGVVADCGDGTSVIPFLAPGDSVTCSATGAAVDGEYRNIADVSGTPILPDFDACGCDPTDPTTWPTDVADYIPALDADGAPLEPVTDVDESGYDGLTPAPAIDVEKSTDREDADLPPGPIANEGGPIVWEYVVTNSGDVPLANAVVADSDPAVVIVCPASLADAGGDATIDLFLPGESVACTATGIAIAGQYENTATVTGDPLYAPNPTGTWSTDPADYAPITNPDGSAVDPVTDADDSHYWGAAPAIDIEKATNGDDADVPTGPVIVDGGTVTWTYVVVNTGNTSIVEAVVTDSQGVVVDCGGSNTIPLLRPNDSVTCTGMGTAVPGQYSNTATVSGTAVAPPFDTCGCDPLDSTTWPTDPTAYVPVSDENGDPLPLLTDADDSHYVGLSPDPALTLEKSTNGEDADAAPGPALTDGDAVTWEYVVTNSGSTALASVTVTDSQGVAVDCGDGTNVIALLAPGASVTCTGTGTATVGQYNNIGSVSGDPVVPDFATCGCDPLDPTTWPTDPAGYVPATGADGSPLVSPSAEDPSHYIGEAELFDVADTVFFDEDGDGVQDPGEGGAPGVTITIRDEDGNVVATVVTDENGNWNVDDLPAGEYTFSADLPDGWRVTATPGPFRLGPDLPAPDLTLPLVREADIIAFTGTSASGPLVILGMTLLLAGTTILGWRQQFLGLRRRPVSHS